MSRQAKSSRRSYDENQESIGREILEYIVFLAIIFAILFAIRHFLFVPVVVDGPSMEPTLQDGDRLILNKRDEADHLDVVVFPAPDGSYSKYIKRVIAKEGDSLAYQDGQLYINDQPVAEPYLEELIENDPNWPSFVPDFTLEELTGQAVVPPDHYFVLGDNRANSKDSRSFGFIPEEAVEGTANFRIWPLNKFGNVNSISQDNQSQAMAHFPTVPSLIA